jgi:hypothetical protein
VLEYGLDSPEASASEDSSLFAFSLGQRVIHGWCWQNTRGRCRRRYGAIEREHNPNDNRESNQGTANVRKHLCLTSS